MRCSSSSTLQTSKPIEQNSSLQTNTTGSTIESILVIFLLISLTLGAFLYKKYRAYRNATLQIQIATLERLWEVSPRK
jgi:hypothetical protein